MPIYMHNDLIAGDSSANGYARYFDVTDLSFDVFNPTNAALQATKPIISPLTITLASGYNAPRFMLYCGNQRTFAQVTVAVVAENALGKPIGEIDTIIFQNAKLVEQNCHLDSGSDSAPQSLSFSFELVKWSHREIKADQSLGAPTTITWDVLASYGTIGN